MSDTSRPSDPRPESRPEARPEGDAIPEPPESRSEFWERFLPRFSLGRPVTVLVFLVSMLVVGAVATQLIPLELIPDGFSPNSLRVYVPWQDAPSQETVDKIVLPLEEELSTVKGISRVVSVGRRGSASVYLSFKQGTDMDVAYREVRDRVQRARLRMPDDVERVFIRKEDPAGIPVLVLGLAVDPDLTDPYNLIEYQVKRPLERLDGVANIEVNGLEEKEILIELDRDRTEAAGLDIYTLAQELGGDNFTLASGHVNSGGKKLLLRSVATYDSLEALENRPLGDGTVRLGDVGVVRYAEPEKRYVVRANSRPTYAMLVFKEGQANTIDLAERLATEIERMEADPRLAGIDMMAIFNQGDVIMESLDTLLDSGLVGGLFAVVVMFFFLRRLRMTLIITLSIPLSILIALTVMYFVGETLNIFSLLALMISVGLLVDNAVVVGENIYRLHDGGAGRREACVRGAGEMALAITMATLTTVVVFLPISLVDGQGQFFLQRLAIPISVSLLASLVVALVVIPLAVYVTLSRRAEGEAAGAGRSAFSLRLDRTLRRGYAATFGNLNRFYNRLLAGALERRLDLVLVTLFVFVASMGLFISEAVRLAPAQEDEQAGFELDVELPDDTTLEEAEAYFLEAEDIVESLQDDLGLDGWLVVAFAGGGEIQGWFAQERSVDLSPRQAAERVRDSLPERAGVEFYLGNENQTADDETDSTHSLTILGDDPVQLERVAESLEDVLRQVDGVVGIQKTDDDSPNELGLVIDRDRAQRQRVNPSVVAGLVGYALRGQSLPRYSWEGREVPVRVRFQEDDRSSLTELADFAVPTQTGEVVTLSSITDVERLETAQRIVRRDKQMARRITVELVEGEEEEARERLNRFAAGLDLPEGVSLRERPISRSDEEVRGMALAALLSMVFIYLLMGFLFESFVLPISILATVPLASIGVAWIHFFTGKSLDLLGGVGAVLLIGVVVNNGIVLVDAINRLREIGHERREAILLAAERRFRPIMMTALTTVCGMVPLTLGGATSIGISYTSFGLTLIGGMTTATLLTLLVVPVFYTLVEDGRGAIESAARRGARRRGREASAPTAAATGAARSATPTTAPSSP